jgi:hypothetical protein
MTPHLRSHDPQVRRAGTAARAVFERTSPDLYRRMADTRPGARGIGHHGGVPSTLRRRSAVFLVYLHQLPRWVPLVVFPALLIGGLAAPGAAGAALLAVLAIVLWFTFMAAPARSASHRLVRFAVPIVVAAAAVGKLVA